MSYRTECFVILLINAWELILKSILSKNRQRIYYPKKRNQPYRTLYIYDAIEESKKYFPADIPFKAVSENLYRLIEYRNNSIHFYNEVGMEIIIYGLAQTSIINYRDLVKEIFSYDIADEVNFCLLPLSFASSPDPIVRGHSKCTSCGHIKVYHK